MGTRVHEYTSIVGLISEYLLGDKYEQIFPNIYNKTKDRILPQGCSLPQLRVRVVVDSRVGRGRRSREEGRPPSSARRSGLAGLGFQCRNLASELTKLADWVAVRYSDSGPR